MITDVSHGSVSVRNFYEFSIAILATGLLNIGFGAIDIVMLVPFGVSAVAGVGLANILLAAMLALSYGFLDQTATSVARATGGGRFSSLAGWISWSAILFVVPWGLGLYLLSLALPASLSILGQPSAVINVAKSYLAVRAPFMGIAILQLAASSSLRICGLKRFAVVILFVGFSINGFLNWVFLYADPFRSILSPDAAVGWSTVVAQLVMALSSGVAWVRLAKRSGCRFALHASDWPTIQANIADYFRATWTVGIKHLNDYAGSFILMILIGQLGATTLASAQIAATVMTVFYRLPQAFCDATLVSYSYISETTIPMVRAVAARKLFHLVTWPTLAAGTVVAGFMPWIVGSMTDSSSALSQGLATALARTDLCFLPFYVFQHFLAQFLIVEKNRQYLFISSVVTTYLVFLPLAVVAKHLLASPVWMYGVRGLSLAVVAISFWLAVRHLFRSQSSGVAERIPAA